MTNEMVPLSEFQSMFVCVCFLQSKEIQYKYDNVAVYVPYDLRCQYRVQVKAVYKKSCGAGGSDWSDVELYGTYSTFFLHTLSGHSQ